MLTKSTVTTALGLALVLASIALAPAAQRAPVQPPAAPQTSVHRAVLEKYCYTCHSEKLHTADLALSKFNLDNIGEGAATWEKVAGKLRSEAMPPAGAPRPDKATYDALASYLESELDRAASVAPNPGRPSLHRLNRTEYANAIRDLLAVEVDGEALLPADDASYGFDNIGDVLTVSPALLERYMSAAAKISSLAVGDPAIGPSSETYSVSDRTIQEDRASEALPFGSRGGVAVAHYFPLNGDYTIRIRLQRDRVNDIVGLSQQHQLDVRLDGALIKSFAVGGENESAASEFNPQDYRKPISDTGEESYKRTADAGLEFRFTTTAGPHSVGVSFLKKAVMPEGTLRRRYAAAQYTNDEDIPGVGRVTITGPFDAKGSADTPSRHRIFVCHPANQAPSSEDTCARKIISTIVRRAYRRPVTSDDLQRLMEFYKSGRSAGGFESGIRLALRRILVSPEFLFRVERDPANVAPNTPYRMSAVELASRLSFFLWSSIPDDELLDVAERGKLNDPAALEQQVRRMLADPRSKALIDNFVGQWLYVRNMQKVVPDPEAFPEFDDNLREAFEQETAMFFDSMLREDRSVLDLLNADYTFLNERLARHYGIPNIYGSHFRRVVLNDTERRGLIGQGSVLTVTSYATRTSPTLRGKWLLENILGAPPPPPPANVPSLKDRSEDGTILSVREQMELHRKSPACAGCHARMDPLGFAIENFDAIGRWRTNGPGNAPIDSSGVLPDGTKFQGPAELRELLLGRKEEFARTVTEKLLIYSLGRGLEYYDAPTIRKIVREAAPADYRWSSLILGIVKSTPFQMRRSRESS